MENEATLRLGCFLGVFAVMATWEVVALRRPRSASKPLRWVWNFGLAVTGTALLQILGFVLTTGLAVGMAQTAKSHGWGLLNQWPIPPVAAFAIALLVLDFSVYLQHVLSHKVPLLWRLHKVHHTDRDLDVTSALRFHPLEIALSMLYKMAWVAALGAPAAAVLAFEVILNGMAMFNHGSVQMPLRLDRLLRWFVVTPDMHRVHHSDWQVETDSNYGFNLSWWDRLFRTYRAEPRDGHLGMNLGLADYPEARRLHLARLLLLPFLPPVPSGHANGSFDEQE